MRKMQRKNDGYKRHCSARTVIYIYYPVTLFSEKHKHQNTAYNYDISGNAFFCNRFSQKYA